MPSRYLQSSVVTVSKSPSPNRCLIYAQSPVSSEVSDGLWNAMACFFQDSIFLFSLFLERWPSVQKISVAFFVVETGRIDHLVMLTGFGEVGATKGCRARLTWDWASPPDRERLYSCRSPLSVFRHGMVGSSFWHSGEMSPCDLHTAPSSNAVETFLFARNLQRAEKAFRHLAWLIPDPSTPLSAGVVIWPTVPKTAPSPACLE